MALAAILKAPADARHVTAPLRAGFVADMLVSASVEPRGLVPGAPALLAEGLAFGGAADIALSGGGDGEQYLVRILCQDVDGAQEQAEIEVSVVEPGWAMPDGGAAYLSILEFVERFGFDETVRMTDARGDGRIDRTYLVNALIDVQAEIDTNLASRYALPLDPVPDIVKRWMADLARGRLYPRGAPDGVADAAKAAVRMLERIAKGEATLPGGAAPSEAPSETPVLIAGGKRYYPDGLARF